MEADKEVRGKLCVWAKESEINVYLDALVLIKI